MIFEIISLLWVKGKKRRHILANLSYDGKELEEKKAEIDAEGDMVTLALSLLEIKKKYGKIDDYNYEKEYATIKGESWFKVKNVEFSISNPQEGNFELDWNSDFIAFLIKNGFKGDSEEDIIGMWFNTLIKNIALEEGMRFVEER